jgi:hypothetical protein
MKRSIFNEIGDGNELEETEFQRSDRYIQPFKKRLPDVGDLHEMLGRMHRWM